MQDYVPMSPPISPERFGVFARQLVSAQADAGLTAEALARELNVSVRLVQRWRRGPAQPSGQNLVALAAVLKRDPAWFFKADAHVAAPAPANAEAA